MWPLADSGRTKSTNGLPVRQLNNHVQRDRLWVDGQQRKWISRGRSLSISAFSSLLTSDRVKLDPCRHGHLNVRDNLVGIYPLFVDARRGGFRLCAGSPALADGFRRIP